MLDMLRELTALDGVSGEENAVRDYIISKIEGHCEYKIDPLGSIIAFKKGKNRSAKRTAQGRFFSCLPRNRKRGGQKGYLQPLVRRRDD